MVTRDFDAMLAERAGIRPTFRVGGQEFTLRKRLPYAKWNSLLAAMRSSEDATAEQANQTTIDFFDVVLIKADRERFAALVRKGADSDDDDDGDDDNVIDLSQMNDMIDWIIEVFTGKTPSSSTSSSNGSKEIGAAPNVVSLSSKQPANAN
jgi:hypothetical protein